MEDDEATHESSHSPPTSYMRLHLGHVSRSYTSTPSLSSASDTDTESETPSVSSPCPSSPVVDEDALSHYFDTTLPTHADAFDAELFQRRLDIAGAPSSRHNPYFPSVAPSDAAFTSSSSSSSLLSNGTSLLSSSTITSLATCDVAPAIKKIKLQALPSPALQPPSPFSLYPSETYASSEEHDDDENDRAVAHASREALISGKLDGVRPLTRVVPLMPAASNTNTGVASAKRTFVPRPSLLSANGVGLGLSGTSPGLSPELTIEAIRASAYGRPSLESYAARTEDDVLLAPSISRRGSS